MSADHHHALSFARSLAEKAASHSLGPSAGIELRARFERDIEPHFRVEEELLLPALRRVGEAEMVARTEEDHAIIRAAVAAAALGELSAIASFAERLTEHIRFEERELFNCCEERLPSSVLDEVARRSPKVR